MNRFLDSFVGNIEHFMKKTKPTLIGAPGEWGLIEGAIEPDGSEWIRLTQKGREMPRTVGGVAGVSVLRKLLLPTIHFLVSRSAYTNASNSFPPLTIEIAAPPASFKLCKVMQAKIVLVNGNFTDAKNFVLTLSCGEWIRRP